VNDDKNQQNLIIFLYKNLCRIIYFDR